MSDREAILNQLESTIGKTPIIEIFPGKIPNNNRIFAKAEFLNPTGSHYDRVYLELFRKDIENLDGKTLIEVSSGNAGASFAYFCNVLNFPAKLILPNNIPKTFIRNVLKFNSNIEIIQPNGSRYLQDCVNYLKNLLEEDRKSGKCNLYCLNHSRREETLIAIQKIAEEVISQLKELNIQTLDYYIAACGNGSSVIGPIVILKKEFQSIECIVFEPKEAPVGHLKKYEKASTNYSNHHLYGTGAYEIYFPFINDDKYNFKNLVDEVQLISENDLEEILKLRFQLGRIVGYTSLVSFYLAQERSKSEKNKNILMLFYDTDEKYTFNLKDEK